MNILGKSFLQFYMCYPAYILHVLNYYIVFYINICRFSTSRPVFDINNMFGEEDLLGISKFMTAAAAIFNFSKYAFLIEQLRSIADSQHTHQI